MIGGGSSLGLLIQFVEPGGLSKTVGIGSNGSIVAGDLIDGDVVLRRWRSRGRIGLIHIEQTYPPQKVAVCLSASLDAFDH